MNKIAIALCLLATTSVPALAVNDVMNMPSKQGMVVFQHKKHSESLVNCKYCHDKGPGKITGFHAKDKAHKSCKGCHETRMAGPRKCGECHIK